MKLLFLRWGAILALWSTAVALPAQSSPYQVVVVGQHSCPACQAALPSLAYFAPKWAAKGHAVVYYSLDAQPQDYSAYPVAVTRPPQGWEDPFIQQLNTYATPTYYLLDAAGEVVAETETAAALQLKIIALKTAE